MPLRRLAALGAAVCALAAACTSHPAEQPAGTPTASVPALTTSAPPTTAVPSMPSTSADPTPTRTHTATPTPTHSSSSSRRPTPTPTTPTHHPSASALPLDYSTHSAKQVVTVVAGSTSDTQATLQAWRKVSGGWRRVGPSVPAWIGSDGMTAHPSEQLSATPMGSYTLTQAFGHDSDPGTALPYRHTTPADWWISQSGPLYNTLQHCSSNCDFTQGNPNEHLYYETPFYNYAVVIDYNRDPVRQGAGSAFFLHVTNESPTAGCVSIDQGQLVRIMQWLDPGKHPRILIGTD